MEKVQTMMKKKNNLPRIKRNIWKDIKEIGWKRKISTQEKIVPPPMDDSDSDSEKVIFMEFEDKVEKN